MNPKITSGTITALLTALVLLLLSLNIFAYTPPDPPIPEEGVEVSLGDSDFGRGNNDNPASQATSYAPPAAQEQVVTQQSEVSEPIPSNPTPGNVTNPAAEQKTEAENKNKEKTKKKNKKKTNSKS